MGTDLHGRNDGSGAVQAPQSRVGADPEAPSVGGARASLVGAPEEGGVVRASSHRSASSPVAIIVSHGMGEQVPFETLNSVAAALWVRQSDRPLTASDARVRYVAFGEEWLPRVELTLSVSDDARNGGARSDDARGDDVRKGDGRSDDVQRGDSGERDVHLYEVYWAPLTEGKVTLRDVLGFLVSAGLRGIRYCARGSFDRWMFGSLTTFRLPRRGVLQLGSALGVLCALTLVAGALALAGVAELFRVIQPGAIHAPPVWLHWTSTPAALAAIGGGAIFFAALRWFLVQSVGDVVAYISAHHASRFTEIRRGIQAEARRVARNVYASRIAGHGELEYGHVIIVGHSLGSVIAYDMLNDSINRDLLAGTSGGETLDVVQRTKLLLTMGSPLDKTAFIFRTQKDDAPLREALAAAAQPMIVSYANRPERWINIWTPFDWVSGSLEYYDAQRSSDPASGTDTSSAARRLRNVENIRERSVPLDTVRAHLGYWTRAEFGKRVFEAIVACSPGTAGARGVSAEEAQLPEYQSGVRSETVN